MKKSNSSVRSLLGCISKRHQSFIADLDNEKSIIRNFSVSRQFCVWDLSPLLFTVNCHGFKPVVIDNLLEVGFLPDRLAGG